MLKIPKKSPLISVVLTTHNRPVLLQRTLESLLKQSFQDFEIILCADETQKETRQTATEYLRPNDTFISSPHLSGPSESRNIGISLSRGNWICFLDDDDTFDENYFNSFFLLNKPCEKIIYTNYSTITESREGANVNYINRENSIIQDKPIENIYIHNFIPINTIFIPRHIARFHDFDVNLETHEDWDYFIRLKTFGVDFEFGEGISGANIHLSNETSRNKKNSIPLDFLSIYRKWPSQYEIIKKARATLLAQWGLNIAEAFL
jgi:glycosyltransferase involved in cell wall biosynthesis